MLIAFWLKVGMKKDLLNKGWEWQPWPEDAEHNQQSLLRASAAKLQFKEIHFHPFCLHAGLGLHEALRCFHLVPPFTREVGSQIYLTVVWTRNNKSWVSLGLKVTELQQLHPMSQSLYNLGPARRGRVWVLADLILLVFYYKEPGGAGMGKELTLGRNTSFSDVFPSHGCPIPGISNHGRQVFLLLHTSGTWIPAVQLFPPDRVSDILSESGKPARIMSWLRMALGKNFAPTQKKLLLRGEKKKKKK